MRICRVPKSSPALSERSWATSAGFPTGSCSWRSREPWAKALDCPQTSSSSNSRPGGNRLPPSGGSAPKRRLTLAEKQIIQAVLQDPKVATSLQQFVGGEFLSGVWAGRVIEKLIGDPSTDIERALDGLGDGELEQEVRAAAVEPFGKIPPDVAIVSMGQLYQDHLVKTEREIRKQLEAYKSGSAPAELVRRRMEIASEKSRLKAMRP